VEVDNQFASSEIIQNWYSIEESENDFKIPLIEISEWQSYADDRQIKFSCLMITHKE